MTAEQLKASILQMAIEGKLVPQIDDEPAVDIEAVEPEEVPFAIPEKWKWCTINDVVTKLTDGEHKTPKYQNEGIHFVSVKNISSGKLILSDTKYIKEEDYKTFIKRCFPQHGDILLSKVGTTGVPVIVDTDIPFALFVSVALLKLKKERIYDKFAYFLLQSPLVQAQAKENTRGVGNKNWVLSAIGQTIIALPPLAEQQRIVTRLEEILPYFEKYNKAHSALKNAEEALPDQLRASLLLEAIQGKLVPQLDDEPAVYMDTAEVEDAPFGIPEKWKWVRLNDVSSVISKGTTPTGGQSAYKEEGIGFIRAENIGKDGHLNIERIKFIEEKLHNTILKRSILKENDLLICIAGTLGRSAVVEGKYLPLNTNQAVSFSRLNIDVIDPWYAQYAVSSGVIQKLLIGQTKVTAIPNLTLAIIRDCPIPLPPLAEQRRIVARLEELLPHVDAIAGLR